MKAAGSAVTVSVLQNVYAEDMVHQALPEAKVDQYESVDLMYQALNSGRADAAATDISSLRWFMKQNPDKYVDARLRLESADLFLRGEAGASRIGCNFVNTALHEAMTGVDSRPTRRPSKRWFGERRRRRRSASRANCAEREGRRRPNVAYTLNFGVIWANLTSSCRVWLLGLGLALASLVDRRR